VSTRARNVSAETLVPEQDATITWHFKVSKQPANGTQIFTHLADGTSEGRINLDSAGKLRSTIRSQLS
jgi:hypothetical protein